MEKMQLEDYSRLKILEKRVISQLSQQSVKPRKSVRKPAGRTGCDRRHNQVMSEMSSASDLMPGRMRSALMEE